MGAVRQGIEGKSRNWIEGYKAGIRCFAYWKNGVQFVGTCGTRLVSVIAEIDEYLYESGLHDDPTK